MQSVILKNGQSQLADILAKLLPGEEVVLMRDEEPVATLRSITPYQPQAPDARLEPPGRLAVRTLPVAQAEGNLDEILRELPAVQEFVLTGNGKLIAMLRLPQMVRPEPPRLGTLHGTILYLAPDFDEIPEGFEDYLP